MGRHVRELFAASASALAALLLVAPAAWAEDDDGDEGEVPPDLTAVVLFAADGVDPSIASAFGRNLRQVMAAARAAGETEVPPVADLAPKNDGMLIVEGEQRLITARRFLGRGIEYLIEDNEKRAYEEFHRGLHYYRTAYPYAENANLYRDLVFYLAETSGSQRDPREKTKRWCEHLGLNVEITGAFDYLERVNKIYTDCDWVIDDPELKTLTITTTPPGARVYIDGIYRGVTPLEVSDLRRGEHLFTFEREGFRRVGRVMVVGAKFAETRELELGLSLKPGVYQYLYGDLVPVVASADPADKKVLQNAAYALEVKNLLLVLVDSATDGKKKKKKKKKKRKKKKKADAAAKRGVVKTLHYSTETSAVTREDFPTPLTEAGLDGTIADVIKRHYGATAPKADAQAPRTDPVYFKLQAPPFVVKDPDEE